MPPSVQTLSLLAYGAARAELAQIAALRKSLPAWVPPDTASHFLKHADEQTVLAVNAIDQAIHAAGGEARDYRNWAIIAAPRFIGRISGVNTLARFSRGGSPSVSPHTIPQHSLHSISGALSILLASRQPNLGVGGTAGALAEGLFAAATFPVAKTAGLWLVATAWEPEPQLDDQGNCVNAPVCHALALSLRSAAAASAVGRLSLQIARPGMRLAEAPSACALSPTVPELIAGLQGSNANGRSRSFRWDLPWGATLTLETQLAAARLPAAA